MAEPASAEVFANGRAVGKSGQTIRLPAARTDIEVRLAGFRPYRTTVTPRPGLPQVLNVRLEAGRGATDAPPATVAQRRAGSCRRSERRRRDRLVVASPHADDPHEVRCRAATARAGELHDGQSAPRIRSPRQ